MSLGLCLGGVTQEGIMISNLPLLFADGYPTCLEKITAGQLEKFVPFMIQCSSGHNASRNLTTPKWWPEDLQFSIPLVKPSGLDSKWLAILKSLVCRCYTYHGCEFMLRFCTDLSQCPTTELMFVSSWDGTTSLYNKVTGKLLVTFRNENMCYDTRKESPQKTPKNEEEPMKPQIVVQPPLFDIYLCDSCDGEFSTLKEVKDHEKTCRRFQQDTSSCPVEELNTEQEKFLNYFHLADAQHAKELGNLHNAEPPRFKRGVGNSLRYTGIPLTSPLGMLVHKKSRASLITASVHLDRVERYCSAKPPDSNIRIREPRCTPWPITWKPRKKGEDDDDWVHTYKHPKRQWRRRAPFMLDELSVLMEKLIMQCQGVSVCIRKLTKKEIEYYCKDKSKDASLPHENQSSEPDEIPVSGLSSEEDLDHMDSDRNTGEMNSSVFHPSLIQSEPFEIDDETCNANYCASGNTVNELDNPTSYKQLLPNMLYIYEKTETSVQSNQCPIASDQPIPIIDLVSSEDETSDQDINRFSGSSPGFHSESIDCTTCLPSQDNETVMDSSMSSDMHILSHSYAHSFSEEFYTSPCHYETDLPQLVELISNSELEYDTTDDQCLLVSAMNQRNPQTGIERENLQRRVYDKAVQCSYEDFQDDSTVMEDDQEEGEEEEVMFQHSKLPKLLKPRRES